MSRSNNTELVNPATRFFEWNGDKGGFKYYDKTAEKNVEVPLPFSFLVLDQLSTIAGYSDADSSGFWSNEIRDTKTEILNVRTKKGLQMSGLYEQVKEKLGAAGADYAKSVYIAYYNAEKELVIGNIKMKGTALGAWIEFCKKNKVYETAVTVKDFTEGRKGKTVFQTPNFKAVPASPASNDAAIVLDRELQAYLTEYFKRAGIKPSDTPADIPGSDAPMPINEPEPVSEFQQVRNDAINNNTPDDDSDLPF